MGKADSKPCARCKTEPRRVARKSGKVSSYCWPCERETLYRYFATEKGQQARKRANAAFNARHHPTRVPTPTTPASTWPCARCGVKPRHVQRRGFVLSYCFDCHSAYQRAYRAARQNGAAAPPPASTWPCARCGVNPRHVQLGGHVVAYCTDCNREYQRAYRAKYTARYT